MKLSAALCVTLTLFLLGTACSSQAEPEPAPEAVEAPAPEVAPAPPKRAPAPPRAPLEAPGGAEPDGRPVTAETLGLRHEPRDEDAPPTPDGDADPGPPCPDKEGKHYVAPKEACGKAEFTCKNGQSRFDDGCGCGCK